MCSGLSDRTPSNGPFLRENMHLHSQVLGEELYLPPSHHHHMLMGEIYLKENKDEGV